MQLMRVGTWNVDNRVMRTEHKDLLLNQKCDIWLLTEVNPKWFDETGKRIMDFHAHRSKGIMGRKQHWAAVLCTKEFKLKPQMDPHPASAAATIGGITFCSTILPWKGVKKNSDPWNGSNHAEMTEHALASLVKNLRKRDLVWGGDWNHSLNGKEHAGSMGGRTHLLAAIEDLNLQVPTSVLSHRGDYCTAIDHIGVPGNWAVSSAIRIDATGLSDHDAYVVEVSPP